MVISKDIKSIVKRALKEDLGRRDITTGYMLSPKARAKARIMAKEDLVLCGVDIAREVFRQVDKAITFKARNKDGARIRKGSAIIILEGKAASILKAERVALNFLTHLSGIASGVRRIVNIAERYKVRILDTRKTIPTLRSLQKYAVRSAGAANHRRGLWDEVMIKENHLLSAGIKDKRTFDYEKLTKIIKHIKKTSLRKVEVEVENLREFKAACRASPDVILLDNFNPGSVKLAVDFRNRHYPRIRLEASGGINLSNIERFARTGVDFISIGHLTHSPRACDISLEICPVNSN